MSAPPQSSDGPKIRRKATTPGFLQQSTSIQRLVEYFVVITPSPRWTKKVEVSADDSQRISYAPSIDESRQGSGVSSHGTEGNIHMPTTRNDYAFQPDISARYPKADYHDNPLNPMILQFCFPSGDVITPSQTYQLPQVHHFVLTNEQGRKVYGTCLTVFEEYEPDGPWKSQAMTLEGVNGIELAVDERGKLLYLPKVLCLLSTWPYLTAFREYLAQLYRLATTTNVMTTPIERYIVNICCEIPAPPPGAYEVQVNILDSTIRFWAPPAKLPIAYVALPYQVLFECLDIHNILSVWTAMILERKILLLSSHYSVLTVCAELLCSLLFPMRWSHLYVPLLPKMFAPMLDAPVPFICGVVRDSWMHTQKFLSKDVIVVDLDNNCVEYGRDFPPIPPPPTRKFHKLKMILMELVGPDFWRAHGAASEYEILKHKQNKKGTIETLRKSTNGSSLWKEKRASLDNAFRLAYTPDSPCLLNDTLPESEKAKWASVQEAFHQFFVSALKDYRRHVSVVEGSRSFFDQKAFLAQQKSNNIPFISEMCMSQQFNDFLTRRLHSPGDPDLIFFDQSIDAKKNRSKLQIRKKETPFLQSANAHKDLKKFISITPSKDGLAEEGKRYVYKKWPDSFVEDHFSEPRPIPKMITAEFDRQAGLVAKLRSEIYNDEVNCSASNDFIIELYHEDYGKSPELATFSVFFFTYCSMVGRDWRRFINKRKLRDYSFPTEGPSMGCYQEDAKSSVEAYATETRPLNRARSPTEAIVSDLTFGVCDTCTQSNFQAALKYIERHGLDHVDSLFFGDEDSNMPRSISVPKSCFSAAYFPGEDISSDIEEARAVASAQLDLAFQTLETAFLRGLSLDYDSYSSLMESCGRCGDTRHALQLIELMKNDGHAADSEVLSHFVAAFAHGEAGMRFADAASREDNSLCENRVSPTETDAYTRFLKKNAEVFREGTGSLAFELEAREALSDGGKSDSCSDTSGSFGASQSGSSMIIDWLSKYRQSLKKKKRRKKASKLAQSNIPVTEMINRQLVLGECLLDLLYPDLKIQTDGDSCPHCSYILREKDVVAGWSASFVRDFKTSCPQCNHRFVAQFHVSTSASNFKGSQGEGTPLYCEFLSPWTLRKELEGIIHGPVGIDGIMSREWRDSSDWSATLFWNLILLFRRYRLPFAFLLQGSFNNLVILPPKPDELA